jgi:hypothetical protein
MSRLLEYLSMHSSCMVFKVLCRYLNPCLQSLAPQDGQLNLDAACMVPWKVTHLCNLTRCCRVILSDKFVTLIRQMIKSPTSPLQDIRNERVEAAFKRNLAKSTGFEANCTDDNCSLAETSKTPQNPKSFSTVCDSP